MAKTSLHISIPEPCHEDWSKMTPTQCGAYCNACQKEVVDFSQMSEAEIVDRLSKASGKVCGRIRADKLDRELARHEPDHAWYSWKKWAVATGVLLGVSNVKANADTAPKPAEVSLADTAAIKPSVLGHYTTSNCALTLEEVPAPYLPAGQTIVLEGVISDNKNQPIPYAKITIGGMVTGNANSEGIYKMELPAEKYYNRILPVMAGANMYGDTSQLVLLDTLNKKINFSITPLAVEIIALKVEAEFLSMSVGFMVMKPTPASRIRNFFRRIAYAFRKPPSR